MMELTTLQWVKHTVTHPFVGFEDMRWKKSGSFRLASVILLLWFIAAVLYERAYGFQFKAVPDRVFNIVHYFVQTVVVFLTWVIGNWSVCTLLDGEGTLRRIYIYSAYALVPYIASRYLETFLSHILIRDEVVFLEGVRLIGICWSTLLLVSAMKAVHQYSIGRTVLAMLLTVAAMAVMLFLMVLVLAIFQQMAMFLYAIYTEIAYRIQV